MSSQSDIPYNTRAPSSQRTLDLHVRADGTSIKPLIVFVHGGAWIADDKAAHKNFAERVSAATGCAVAVPNYTLSPRHPPRDTDTAWVQHPAHAQDVLDALEFLLTWNGSPPDTSDPAARRTLYDASTIFAIGHSCGSHLLGSIFLAPPQSQAMQLSPSGSLLRAVRGILTTEGIFDIDLLMQSFPTYREWFLESAFGPRDNYSSVSLTRWNLRSTHIRWMLVHSKGDTLVDLAQSRAMYDKLVALHEGSTASVGQNWDTFEDEHDDVLHTQAIVDLVTEFVNTSL